MFYNNIIKTKAFYDNWTLNIKDLSKASYAMNNFIDKPEDFGQYEEYMNFTTEYKISDNDVFITINIPDYVNYYYYLIIKINRY